MDIFYSTIKSTLKRYKPQIIGVTGSVGKTLVVGALKAVVGGHSFGIMPQGDMYAFRAALLGGFGNESSFGLLAKAWWRNMFHGPYSEKIILEFPMLGRAELSSRLRLARPDILVVAGVGGLPINIESYGNREAVIQDVTQMIESVNHKGLVILNADDSSLESMREKAKAEVMTYGFENLPGGHSPDIKISNFENRIEAGIPIGISFKLEHGGSFVPVRMDGVFGRSYAYAAASAAAVGIAGGLNLVRAAEALSNYPGEPGKCRLISGLKGAFIIDDTYDSSLWGAVSALEILKKLPGDRKIAVLGDIIGLGPEAEKAHIELGRVAAGIADIIVTVGPRAKFIAETARSLKPKGFEVISFDGADEAKQKVQDILKPKDLVLVKGSKFLKMEGIVLEIMAEPLREGELLVKR